jgi:hypothetical protein
MDDRHPIEATDTPELDVASPEARHSSASEVRATPDAGLGPGPNESSSGAPADSREELVAPADEASVMTATETAPDVRLASGSGSEADSLAESAVDTLERMHGLLDEVRRTMSDPAVDPKTLVESVCDESKLQEHAPELDQMLSELLSDEPSGSTAAHEPTASADEALAAVDQAMAALAEAHVEPVANEASAESASESPVETAVETPVEADPEPEPELQPETQPEPQLASSAAPEPAPAPESTIAAAAAAESAPIEAPEVAATAVVAATVAAIAPTVSTPIATPAAEQHPKVALGTRLKARVGGACAAVDRSLRQLLTALASLVPAKLRMITGIAAATMLLWVPIVWMMAKTVASNDRIRPLSKAELHMLVESTHATGDAAKDEKKDEKKDDKKEDKKADKKKDAGGGGH